jgi:hypothetical protein
MKRRVNVFIDRFTFGPLILFAGGGLAVFASMYVFPAPPGPLIAAIIGSILLSLFVVFLSLYRSGDRGAIGAAAPATIGPFLAHLYVKYRAPHLLTVLNSGGDLLIQLAFFFASLFGAAVYMFVMFGEDNVHHRTEKIRTCFVLFFIVFTVITIFDITDQAGIAGPPITSWIDAPRLTCLTVSRTVLALLSVVVASWPKSCEEDCKRFRRV